MTLQEFINFFNGIFCDYDGADGDQCFDLANAYSRWIGGQRFTGATADLIFNQPGDFYIAIPNTPDGVPQAGDIVIWNWPHVGIATGNNSTTSQFEVLEQNDPTYSNCHLKTYLNYNGVIGWLRPKQLPQDLQSQLDELRKERDNNWNLYQTQLQKTTDLQTALDKCNQDLSTCQSSSQTPTVPPTPPVVTPSTPPVEPPTPQVPPVSPNPEPKLTFLEWVKKVFYDLFVARIP